MLTFLLSVDLYFLFPSQIPHKWLNHAGLPLFLLFGKFWASKSLQMALLIGVTPFLCWGLFLSWKGPFYPRKLLSHISGGERGPLKNPRHRRRSCRRSTPGARPGSFILYKNELPKPTNTEFILSRPPLVLFVRDPC